MLVVGLIYAIRRPKLKRLTVSDYPGVDEAKFVEWHRQQLRAVNIFLWATWGAFLVKVTILVVLSGSHFSQATALTWTILILVAWLVGLLVAAGAGSKAKRLRKAAGISWPAPDVSRSSSQLSEAAVAHPRPDSSEVEFYQYDMRTIEALKTCAVCSDKGCPCPETPIPEGSGYLYISQEAVVRMKAIKGGTARGALGVGLMPLLVCGQGARLRGIDLKVAADDARQWWESGKVPLRATPMA